MVLICIGITIAIIVIIFVYYTTENHNEWVFRFIKMNGMRFEILCDLVVLFMMGILYALKFIISKNVVGYICILVIYLNIIPVFLAPIKLEAEYCRMKKWGYEVDPKASMKLSNIFLFPFMEMTHLVIPLYTKIINGWHYENPFFSDVYFRMMIVTEIIKLFVRYVSNKRYKKMEKILRNIR